VTVKEAIGKILHSGIQAQKKTARNGAVPENLTLSKRKNGNWRKINWVGK
jgi:hypothetical protein